MQTFAGDALSIFSAPALRIQEYALNDPAARPRRIAITPDDQIWYTDSGRPPPAPFARRHFWDVMAGLVPAIHVFGFAWR